MPGEAPRRDLTELFILMAEREACFSGRPGFDRVQAALPELTEKDLDTLMGLHLLFFSEGPGALRSYDEALLQSVIVGVELGREMERWSYAQVTNHA